MKRPIAVTVIGWLFIGAGVIGLAYHLSERPLDRWILALSIIRILAVIGGIALLAGQSWARWLILAWLAFHVVLSAFHSLSESMAHLVLTLVVGCTLLRPPASKYFRSVPPEQSR